MAGDEQEKERKRREQLERVFLEQQERAFRKKKEEAREDRAERLRWQRLRNKRVKRTKEIAEFTQAQRGRRDWISFTDIADHCAHISSDIKPDQERRDIAYDRLARALLSGEFDEDGRSQVRFLSPERASERLTAADLTKVMGWYDPAIIRNQYLAHCWIPAHLMRRWFQSQRMDLPPWLPAAANSEIQPGAQPAVDAQVVAGATGGRVLVEAKHPGGRPPKDRTLFNQEVSRYLSLDGNNATRTELRKHMKEWADKNLKDRPDDRSIERWTDELVPDDALNN